MQSIEQLLAFHAIQTNLMNKVQEAAITEDEQGEPWLVFKLVDAAKSSKAFKKRISEVLWGTLTQLYETYVATQLLRQGYLCVPIDGGWLVVSPEGEEYQLQEHTCTCQHFTSGKSQGPCKHLIFRDWSLSYKARINEYKRSLVTR